MPAVSAVFTISYVAEMLGEDKDWLHELSIDMFAEDGCLWVYGVGEDGVCAFTDYDIECLKSAFGSTRIVRFMGWDWEPNWKRRTGRLGAMSQQGLRGIEDASRQFLV